MVTPLPTYATPASEALPGARGRVARVLLGEDLEEFVECGGGVGDLRGIRQSRWRNSADKGKVGGIQHSLFLSLLWVVEGVRVVSEVFRELHFLNGLPNVHLHRFTLGWLDNGPVHLLLVGVRRAGDLVSRFAGGRPAFLFRRVLWLERALQGREGERDAEGRDWSGRLSVGSRA